MTNVAERNRAIKATLGKAFGRDKVRVRGSRGTGYGYVYINVDHTPLCPEKRIELERQCYALLRAAKIDLGKMYTDDTCQYETSCCSISFERCQYERTSTGKHGLWGKPWDSDQYVLISELPGSQVA